MDFSKLEGFEEFFSDGVLDPSIASPEFRENAKRYRQAAHRVFLLYDPDASDCHAVSRPASVTAKGNDSHTATRAEFDMVFIHGIGSDEFKCWTNEKGIVWPAAFIPQDFPSARVLTLGYAHALWNWKGPEGKKEQVSSAPDGQKDCSTTSELVASGAADGKSASVAGGTAPESSRSLSSALDSVWNRLPDIDNAWRSIWPSRDGKKGVAAEGVSTAAPSSTSGAAVPLLSSATVTESAGAAGAEAGPAPAELPPSRRTLYQLLMEDSEARADMYGRADGDRGPAATDSEKFDARQLQSYRVVAADIAERLLNAGVGTGERPVVFVVHSMGGLMIKQLVVSLFQLISLEPRRKYLIASVEHGSGQKADGQESYEAALAQADVFLHSLRGIVFYGTPHFGSGLASVITGLQRYYSSLGGLTPTHVVTGLGDHNKAALTLLNDRFMEVVARLDEQSSIGVEASVGASQPASAVLRLLSAPSLGLSIMSLGETKRLNNLIRIVEPESANPAPDNPRFPFYLIDGDHSQINRPAAKTSPGYVVLYGFLDRLQQRGLLLPWVTKEAALDTGERTQPRLGASQESYREGGESMGFFEDRAWSALQSRSLNESRLAGGMPRGEQDLSTCTEAFILLRALEEAQRTLRGKLARFFGKVTPPQLDGIFLLGADMREFFSRERLAILSLEQDARSGAADQAELWDAHDSFVKSLVIPARLLMYWTVRATDMIGGFEEAQREMMASQAAVEAQRRTSGHAALGGKWAQSGIDYGVGGVELSNHLSLHATREVDALENDVGILQGEWEGFRRCLSLTIRREILHQQGQGRGSLTPSQRHAGSPSLAAMGDERVTIVFFARAVRAVMTSEVRDGGCLSNLVGHFVSSSIEVVTSTGNVGGGGQGGGSGMTGERAGVSTGADDASRALSAGLSRPFIPTPAMASREERQAERLSGFVERDMFAALLAESLERHGKVGCETGADALSDQSASLTARAAPRCVEEERSLPPLHATSSFLLACYHLFLGEFPDRAVKARLLLESTRSSLEQCRRTFAHLERAEQALAKNGQAAEPSSWWRSESEEMARGNGVKAPGLEGEGGVDPWQQTRVLTEAFNLLTHSLACFAYIGEIDAKGSACAGDRAVDSEMEGLLEGLARCVRDGQAAYDRAEGALAGHVDDINRPFAALPASTKADRARAKLEGTARTTPSDQGSERAKRDFRKAVVDALRELDVLLSEKGNSLEEKEEAERKSRDVLRGSSGEPISALDADSGAAHRGAMPLERAGAPQLSSEASAEPWYSTGTSWLSKRAGSVPKLIINSVLNAWEAVRRGGEVKETPEFFASSVFVFWWHLELYASVAHKSLGGGGGYLTGTYLGTWRGPGGGKGASAMEGNCSSDTAPLGGASAAVATPSAPATQRQRMHFAAAPIKVRSQWLSASGFLEAAERRRKLTESMRAELQSVLSSPEMVDPSAVAHRMSALQCTQAPVALGDAFHLDGEDPFTRCLLGHWHFLNLRSSPDAAHSYGVVMRVKHSPLSALHQSAAVGLGWVHLHRLGAAIMPTPLTGSRSGASRFAWGGIAAELGLSSERGEGHRGRVELPTEHILDPLATWAAPSGFVSFCEEAKALLELSSRLSPLAPPRPTEGEGATYRPHVRSGSGSFTGASGINGPQADAVAMRRLSLGEGYFRKVLEADPTNVGALCGMGRLRSLVPGGWTEGVSSWPLGLRLEGEHGRASAVSESCVETLLKVRGASAYFRAAVQAARSADCPVPASLSVNSMLEPTFASYAAYWLGNTCTPSGLTLEDEKKIALSYYEGDAASCGGGGQLADRLLSDHLRQRAAALERAQEWYKRAVLLDPQNDWALTSLGLSFAQRARLGEACSGLLHKGISPSASACATSHPPQSLPSPTHGLALGRLAADMARGSAMLEAALAINPTNQWALWGVANYSTSGQRRDECFQRLRAHLTQRYRLLRRF